jgi:hypothetical protein
MTEDMIEQIRRDCPPFTVHCSLFTVHHSLDSKLEMKMKTKSSELD